MIEISKRMLLLNIILSQGILVILSLLLGWFLFPDTKWSQLVPIGYGENIFITLLGGSTVLLALQLFFHHYVTRDRLLDEINILLINTFSLPELSAIFLFGSLAEEWLFRGLIQTHTGIWIASILFTLIHFRYLKKIFLLLEVFLMGLILGFTYLISQTIWVPIICHFAVNILTAWLIKKGHLQY